MVSAGGAISTLATGTGATVTVIVADASVTVTPVAPMVVVPTPTAETRPLADTVATDGRELVHVIVRTGMIAFDESRPVAISCTLLPR